MNGHGGRDAFTSVIVVLMGVLLGAAGVGAQSAATRRQAQENEVATTVQALKVQIELYKFRNGKLPGSLADLVPRYFKFVPKTPDGQDYLYDAATGKVSPPPGWERATATQPSRPARAKRTSPDARLAQWQRVQTDLRVMSTQLELYKFKHGGQYPASLAVLVRERYLRTLPKLPDGKDYLYNATTGKVSAPAKWMRRPPPTRQPTTPANVEIVKTDLAMIRAQLELFRFKEGRRAKDLGELVKKGYLRRLPTTPDGLDYLYDAKTGEVSAPGKWGKAATLDPTGKEARNRLAAQAELFRFKKRRYPNGLDELVKEGYIKSIPRTPDGRAYQYDPKTGEVSMPK